MLYLHRWDVATKASFVTAAFDSVVVRSPLLAWTVWNRVTLALSTPLSSKCSRSATYGHFASLAAQRERVRMLLLGKSRDSFLYPGASF